MKEYDKNTMLRIAETVEFVDRNLDRLYILNAYSHSLWNNATKLWDTPENHMRTEDMDRLWLVGGVGKEGSGLMWLQRVFDKLNVTHAYLSLSFLLRLTSPVWLCRWEGNRMLSDIRTAEEEALMLHSTSYLPMRDVLPLFSLPPGHQHLWLNSSYERLAPNLNSFGNNGVKNNADEVRGLYLGYLQKMLAGKV